ncbi:hypothetical protein NLG97_g7773 [Lecanicillium saksenae]|uniref:Uncharacterized protein n=1 Tax=Lecanicillium saksenae TaxID=468837 RepID=A0ACC1QKX2_9HYPO|nr:hypothetical protein NLG97_g7773 [Lecanicillium saksenae]
MSQAAAGMSPGAFTTPSRPLRWLITGCSSGLGLALARYAQAQGHYVIATSRDPARTPELVAEIERDGRRHGRWAQLDVTDPASGEAIRGLEEEDALPIDVLVSNAASSVHAVVEAFTEDEVRRQMEVLYLGPFRLVRAVVPYMRRRRFGIVVNISTGAALEGRESMGTYSSGKAATDAMIKVLAKEVAEFNIRTLTVHLGSFNTNMPTAAASGTNPLPEDYKGTVADKTIDVMHNGPFVARGDKDKAVRHIFEVAMGQGAGVGHEGEFFLPLGEEMPARIKLVLVSCVATSAMAVLITIVYYLAVHDAWADPFDAVHGRARKDLPNPLDYSLLYWIRVIATWISKRLFCSRLTLSPRAQHQLEMVLVKFKCSSTALDFRLVLDLAWFTCLTHLTCLTMLRQHLHMHPFERWWRLFGMGVLAIQLSAGLNPASFDSWEAILSAAFVIFAYASRVARLHRSLSRRVSRSADWAISQIQRLVSVLFSRICEDQPHYSLKRSFVYRPLFGLMMFLRFTVDFWSSFAFELGWLITALTWGIWRLQGHLSFQGPFENGGPNAVATMSAKVDGAVDESAWTFGQTFSVLTLAAPVISIITALVEVKRERRNHSTQKLATGPIQEFTYVRREVMIFETSSSPLTGERIMFPVSQWRLCSFMHCG